MLTPVDPMSGPRVTREDRQIQDLLMRREYLEAGRLIGQRLEGSSSDADAWYLSSVMNYFQGKVGRAVADLRKCLELNPRHTDGAICLSVLLNDVGNYGDAKRVFEQANQSVTARGNGADAEIDKKFSVKHLELADLYFRYRRYDEAIEEYGKAAVLDPITFEIRIRRAKAFAKKGFLTRSLQELRQLKTEHPDYFPARIQLGLLHYSQGNVLDAELEWESILEFDSSHREAKTYLEMARASRLKTQ